MKFRNNEREEYVAEPNRRTGKYEVLSELETIEDFKRFWQMAAGARLRKVASGDWNLVRKEKLTEQP